MLLCVCACLCVCRVYFSLCAVRPKSGGSARPGAVEANPFELTLSPEAIHEACAAVIAQFTLNEDQVCELPVVASVVHVCVCACVCVCVCVRICVC